MVYLITGVIGVLAIALIISKRFDARAYTSTRIQTDKPFANAIPGWATLIFLGFFCVMLYGFLTIMI